MCRHSQGPTAQSIATRLKVPGCSREVTGTTFQLKLTLSEPSHHACNKVQDPSENHMLEADGTQNTPPWDNYNKEDYYWWVHPIHWPQGAYYKSWFQASILTHMILLQMWAPTKQHDVWLQTRIPWLMPSRLVTFETRERKISLLI